MKADGVAEWDAIVIGAGPAGLSAALWLGRCGRKTLVYDDGRPRNAAAIGIRGFLTRDGIPPRELLRLARVEIAQYNHVEVRDTRVESAVRRDDEFVITTSGGPARARTLLLATGRRDSVPDAPGLRDFYGRGVYHCPYCDGWEHRGQPLAIYGRGESAAGIAELLRTWSDDLYICTGGEEPEEPVRAGGWRVVTAPIRALRAGPDGTLAAIDFASGETRRCSALFFCSDCIQKSELPEGLGCEFDEEGSVVCQEHAATGVPGLFVAGNVRGGVHLAIMAAAEGAEAAFAMNEYLLDHPTRPAPGAPLESVPGSR